MRDEGDNHVIELAIAGNARIIATNNLRDFRGAKLTFPQLQILNPYQTVTLVSVWGGIVLGKDPIKKFDRFNQCCDEGINLCLSVVEI